MFVYTVLKLYVYTVTASSVDCGQSDVGIGFDLFVVLWVLFYYFF